MMKFGLEQNSIDKISSIFKQYEQIQQVIIYGSRALGNYRSGSDIDLTVKADNFSLSELMKVEIQIDDLLLPYKIDISLFHQISDPELVEHINRVGVIFYEKHGKNKIIKE